MNCVFRLKDAPVRLVRCRYYAAMRNRMMRAQTKPVAAAAFATFDHCQSSGQFHGEYRCISSSYTTRRNLHSRAILFKEYPSHAVFPMPALSPTMEMGSIAKWNLKVGDQFSAGDVLCSVETDKATIDFEAQDDGVLAKILREPPNATDIPIGEPICVVVDDEGDVAAFADFTVEVKSGAPAEPSPTAAASEAPAEAAPAATVTASVPNSSNGLPLLPSARFLSESKGVDATVLTGSGKGGRVTKGDVLEALEKGTFMPPLAAKAASPPASTVTPASAPAPAASSSPPVKVDLPPLEVDTFGGYEDVPNNNMRKVIARRLTESKRDVPHFYTSMEVELDNVLKMRKDLAAKHDVKVSVNDVIIRCCALALRDVPEVNGTYNPKSNSVELRDSIDVSVAVATPTGLITPIVPGTDKMGLSAITDKVRDLAGRARDGKLKPEEYQGGTFCVSNLGMFGIDEFSAVINPPQAAILAVGGGTRRVVPTPYVDGAQEQAKPSIKTIMTARLSADRRVVDEATASLFLSAFKEYINKPELLLL